ncbi:serine/threonine-protein kinase [Nocardioides sp. CFH 31398]|uniref:serine/threonine-protein kinase n=1 Tax=Nocardioides sp. CFH 31398 TaxID=2919579 RepID=UPI001F0663B1|nr:serine/threonine-protein kinase [Nocardioides sp. CFH 31398]MCH1865169.1 serine/threonine protein kinase [Nocardioides sp. CFH 31398]
MIRLPSRRRVPSDVDPLEAARATGALPPAGYEALAVLGHGRRCVTWDAWDLARDARCVVKVLRADRLARSSPSEAEELVASTLAEARILVELGHPHLVRGYEVLTDPLPGMVMETLGGAALDAVVEDAPLSPADAAMLGLQLCSALGWLHRHDWLHLDLKPANVVVQAGQAKVIDLGLAGRPGDGRPGSGTRGYLAPEQAVGHGLSPATDVWGLGVTLLECLTGDLPFGDEATWESRRRRPLLDRAMPTAPRDVPADLPAPLADVLRRCVALDPDARPTLVEVRAVLREITSDR